METAPTLNIDENFEFNLSFELNSKNNNPYSINLYAEANSYILIKATKKDDLFYNSFSNKFTLEKIKENKYFLLFDNLREIFNELSERINMKQISLIEKEQTLDFVISLPVSKIKEIKFELKKDEKKVKEINKELNKLFLDLKNEINSIIIGDNNNYNESLKNWINPKAFIRAEILYRLTRDGEEISTFHKLCDNKGKTLTLMETEEGNKV